MAETLQSDCACVVCERVRGKGPPLRFPEHWPAVADHIERGWTVPTTDLVLEGLVVLNRKLDELLRKGARARPILNDDFALDVEHG